MASPRPAVEAFITEDATEFSWNPRQWPSSCLNTKATDMVVGLAGGFLSVHELV